MSTERKELKSQIARMQAELERLGVSRDKEKEKLCELLKDEIAKIDPEIEKLEAQKSDLQAEKEEMENLLSKLESLENSQQLEDSGNQKDENPQEE